MSRNFNPFKKTYNLETFGDARTSTIRSQYELANKKKQLLKFEHIASGKKISFQAFMEGYSEDYSTSFNPTTVYGRMDPIQTFQGTTRSLSVSWILTSNSVDESEENLLRCQRLAQMLYPVYEDLYGETGVSATSIKAPPLLRVKLMNLVRDVSTKASSARGFEDGSGVGLIVAPSGLQYQPDFSDAGTFDDPSPGVIFPKIIRLSMRCAVLHSHPLGFVQRGKKVAQREPLFPFGVNDFEAQTELDELQKTPIADPPRKQVKKKPIESSIKKSIRKQVTEETIVTKQRTATPGKTKTTSVKKIEKLKFEMSQSAKVKTNRR